MKKAIVLLTVCLAMASTNFAQTGMSKSDTATTHSKMMKKGMKKGMKKRMDSTSSSMDSSSTKPMK